ncbi:hypothetical protein [Paenibacillus prosopidis]|uniref:Uncharacterized protein n=1 Tax=Paenibacillus prosopidis TaxID=630520 RepID=A0A368W746_9BACL|nr:hypothetical protein [Paenibacillus prosopidis]RCW49656.1 hypothetical protein DFP97_104314 [Paenibacillus prosopidis]
MDLSQMRALTKKVISSILCSKWTDARTGSIFEGGQTIHVEAPLSTIPVFLRDGKQAYLIGKI